MSRALTRGRTLDPRCVGEAQRWRYNRIQTLLKMKRMVMTAKERNEARRLTGRWDFWNYKA